MHRVAPWSGQRGNIVFIKVIKNIKNIELFYGKALPRLPQISEGDGMLAEPKTLYDKIWEAHEVGRRSDGNAAGF